MTPSIVRNGDGSVFAEFDDLQDAIDAARGTGSGKLIHRASDGCLLEVVNVSRIDRGHLREILKMSRRARAAT